MYRILKCDKDSYITNKIIRNSNPNLTRSFDSNVGQAGTIDIFKLYNQTSGSGIELSRGLLHFDLDPLRALTGSILNISSPTFKCYISLSDIYGGQTTPSNYSLKIYPLAKEFSEGRGMDVIGFQDIDVVNWLTASTISGVSTVWNSVGASTYGTVGTPSLDYYVSGVMSGGMTNLGVSQDFLRGDEDLLVDVTTLVSATIAGVIPDYGFLLKFSDTEEQDSTTRFVKRFASRNSQNYFKHPKLIAKSNTSFIDRQLDSYFDTTNNIAIYNIFQGNYHNFKSGSTEITGSNCAILELHASKSITYWTSSWSPSHNTSINCLTSSWVYFSTSFTASQLSFDGYSLPGIYYSTVGVSSSDSSLQQNFGNQNINFIPLWKSLDGTVLYASGTTFEMKLPDGRESNVAERNFVVNVTNLKQSYSVDEQARLRVFVQNYNVDRKIYNFSLNSISDIYDTFHWRLIHAWTREVIVPFDLAGGSTALSSDGKGMYFDMYVSDLPVDQVYELEFLIRDSGHDYITTNQGFRFKVST